MTKTVTVFEVKATSAFATKKETVAAEKALKTALVDVAVEGVKISVKKQQAAV